MDRSALAALGRVTCLAIDIDGVLRLGADFLPGVPEAIAGLRRQGFTLSFVTNNSSTSPARVAASLGRHDVPADEADVLTSGLAAATLLRRMAAAEVCVAGTDDLRELVRTEGFEVVSGPGCDTLLVGMNRAFDYDDLRDAADAARACRLFVACNREPAYPVEGRRWAPGCGALVAAVEAAAGRVADVIAGKPEPLLLEMLAQRTAATPDEILVVGDSLVFDLGMARAHGAPAVLVAAGEPAEAGPGPAPVARVAALGELPALLAMARS